VVSGTQNLGVWMNGLRVGALIKDVAGALAFGYAPGWLATPGARPVSLSMPLRHQPHRGEVVYNFFDNLLPDNKQIRNRIQARFKAPSSHPFDLPVCDAAGHCFDGEKALVVECFDRRLGEGWIMRLPQEDMCQALGYSPNIKYESDGGPGVGEIMRFLLQSREAGSDRERFYNSLVLFWLIAAIDGHAKNFSVFIEAGGRFRLTPLYDIMSAHPLMAQKQLQPRKIKMAMALSGKNRHYHWHTMQPRHFISTAEHVGFHAETARRLFNDMIDRVDTVIDKVKKDLPPDFPDAIATPIFAGMLRQRDAAVRGGRL
jgi:serine/threonine-protein kinase HipA